MKVEGGKSGDYGRLPTVNTPISSVIITDKEKRDAARYVVAQFIDDREAALEVLSALGLTG